MTIIMHVSTLSLVAAFVSCTLVSAANAAEPIEVPVWPGVAPGSAGISEKELVVERSKKPGVRDRSISNVHKPTLTVHLPKRTGKKPCAAVIICPGGGLTRVVIDKEGNALAKLLNQHGVAGIVLKFRTVKSPKHDYGVSAAIADVQRAIRLTRANASKWNIDPNRVGVFGFSAGGYLASTAATRFDSGNQNAKNKVERQGSRPDFVGMAYPLISLRKEVSGGRYAKLLLGDKLTDELILKSSNELNVTKQTPRCFIAHAEDDSAVKVENTRRFAAACRKAGVPCTTFIRAKGGHGYGVRDLGTPINKWPTAFVGWLRANQLLTP